MVAIELSRYNIDVDVARCGQKGRRRCDADSRATNKMATNTNTDDAEKGTVPDHTAALTAASEAAEHVERAREEEEGDE